mmetsp:Transcript_38706/g.84811  ORF Transcript_38706/g.84811 Transcript_38706/m.84811 type:complete len:113 (+) Transcript_38706:1883-2221(+)
MPANSPNGQDLGVRKALHQSQKVMQKVATATHSLSKPPAMERMRCAGIMAMMQAAAKPAPVLPDASAVRSARKTVASAPNHAGIVQHTSLRVMGPTAKWPLAGKKPRAPAGR